MFLFLDVISPIPEFFIIEDNKVIFQSKIIKNESEKLSDNIFESFLELNKVLNLTTNLQKIAMTVGPGSYTSLRVGASFLSGLKMSKDLVFCPISIVDILIFKSNIIKDKKIAAFISSGKKQFFLCSFNHKKEIEYLKLEINEYKIQEEIDIIFYNSIELNNFKKIKQYKFSFVEEILNNCDQLVFNKNAIIKPIYISNNKILN